MSDEIVMLRFVNVHTGSVVVVSESDAGALSSDFVPQVEYVEAVNAPEAEEPEAEDKPKRGRGKASGK